MKSTFVFATIISVLISTACSDGGTERDNIKQFPESAGSSAEQPAEQSLDSTANSASAEEAVGEDQTGENPENEAHPTETFQTAEEAEASDMAASAESKGWTLEEAQAYQAGTEAVGDVAVQIDEEHPGILVGSAVGPEPYDPPRLYIKGPADEFVHAVVDAAPVEILIIDNQPYSRTELDERIQMLGRELQRVGFDNFMVAADIQQEGLLEAIVQRTDDIPQTKDEIISLLPESIKNDVRITFSDEPVAVPD